MFPGLCTFCTKDIDCSANLGLTNNEFKKYIEKKKMSTMFTVLIILLFFLGRDEELHRHKKYCWITGKFSSIFSIFAEKLLQFYCSHAFKFIFTALKYRNA